MSSLRHMKSRKFQHQPINPDDLLNLLQHASEVSSPDRYQKRAKSRNEHRNMRGKGQSKSTGKIPLSENRSRKSAPALISLPTENASRSRKNHALAEDTLDTIQFKIGSVTFEMDGAGEWKTSLKSTSLKEEVTHLRKSAQRTYEENNLLKVKNELLLDMIAKKTLRIQRIEKELVRLRKLLSTASSRFSSYLRTTNSKRVF